MRKEYITKVFSDFIGEILLSIKASEGYEKYRLHDDIFFLPEQDRAWIHCALALHERLTGKELLPGGKAGAIEKLDDIDVLGLLKALKKGKDRR